MANTKPTKKKPKSKYTKPNDKWLPDPGVPVWERHKCETDKSFEAFVLYRDMGTSRTINKVSDLMGYTSAAVPNRWSIEYSWITRVSAYQRWIDLQKLGVRQAAIKRCEGVLAEHLEGILTVAIKTAMQGDTGMIKDLLDRFGVDWREAQKLKVEMAVAPDMTKTVYEVLGESFNNITINEGIDLDPDNQDLDD